ncbi:hypothetical protein ACNKU7_04400 [Microbulbifer sp. SA54]|uniref:hypothetical protein n=1 Tax=Microbulbifer sp. SA54 TaxID=3401577 RepID=UPI003AB07464
MKLILHAGPEKTGTSAVQASLFSIRDKLLSKGILYPDVCLWGDKSHHRLAFSMFEIDAWGERELFGDLLARLENEIIASRCETVILSSELLKKAFSCGNFSKFSNFVEKLFSDVIVVLVFREQVSWLASVYNQMVKDPVTKCGLTFSEFVKEEDNVDAMDYYSIASGWRSVPFVSRVLALNYAEAKNDVAPFFFSSIGFSSELVESVSVVSPEVVNQSLDRPHLDLIRFFNRFEMPADERHRLNREIVSLVDSDFNYLAPERSIIKSGDVEFIREHCLRSNQALKDEFGVMLVLPDSALYHPDDLYSGVNVRMLAKLFVSSVRSFRSGQDVS